jgi:hypothetical protein
VGAAEETAVGVLIDNAQRGGERVGFGVGRIAMPLQVGPLPEDPPRVADAHIGELGDGFLDVLAGIVVPRPDVK